MSTALAAAACGATWVAVAAYIAALARRPAPAPRGGIET